MSDAQWPALTESIIRELASSKSYDRGQSYYERGAVSNVVQRGETVRADVEGSQYQPYTVTLEFDDDGVSHTDCSCPYDHGGICKHRIAVLLMCLRDPENVRDKPPLSELVANVDQETLQKLVVDLADTRPEVAGWIETRLETSAAADAVASPETVSVDIESVWMQAEHALPRAGQRGHNDAHAEAQRMAGELDELLQQAQLALDAGDGDTALDILEAITEVLVENSWSGLLPHDVSDLYGTIDDLGELFIEAVLIADLDESERTYWEQQLREWDGDTTFQHFMGRSVLGAAADAAMEGWDDPRIQQAMDGAFEHGEFWTDSPGWYSDDVIDARLRILAAQNRTQEYLNLSLATGADSDHAQMLVAADRIEDAVEYGIEHVSTPRSLLDLAKTLVEHGQTEPAITVAEHGLSVEGRGRDDLAEWLREQAADAGYDQLALEAAITAFEEHPSVNSYKTVETYADDWEQLRTDLLDSLRTQETAGTTADRIAEIFLHEGQYDEAIELAERTGWPSVIETVVTAVTEQRPQWVISTCKSQAEPIIEQGRHNSYETAVRWLRRAGEAAQAADELEAWHEYVETTRDDHYQKYKLRPMLEDLLEEF